MPDALLHAWEKTARHHAARVALTASATGACVTFAELAARGRAWAERHATWALRRRAVLFSAQNGAAWFEVFLGLLHADAVVVPLDPGEPAEALAATARALRAAAWWDGARLHAVEGRARVFRDPALDLVKLTSGSTGAPRPLVFTGTQLLADGRQVMRGMGIGARDTNYALIPFGHSYGLGNLVLPLLAAGVPLVVGGAPFPHAIAADFTRWRPSVFPGVPAVWRGLADADVRLPGLRLAISAGAPLDPAVAARFLARHGVALHSFYGSSETGGVSYDRTGRDTLAGRVGRPLPGVSVAPLRGGRLRVASAAVLTAVHRDREHGRGAWVMPDLVELDARGSLRVTGRRGDFVKIAGRRVSLGEVAAKLRALPGVTDVWVAAGDGADPVLGAAVATALSAAELRARVGAHLAGWKIPRALICLPALPLTARGKTDTAALRARLFGALDRA